MRLFHALSVICIALFPVSALGQTVPASSLATPSLPAFPGAEGFGANTPGGRGGSVYEVTTLNDAGPGSLRDAVSQGNRTIVFRVSGTIDLARPLRITQPFITVAGQTAPGDGICVRIYTFQIQTHDVIVRYIRSRLGDQKGQQNDCFSILNGCHDIILDHCSASWSIDEGLSTSGDDQNVTVQWCMIAEALNMSIHVKGKHGFGSLARANGPISWYHNLWAHNISRNPRLGDAYGKGSNPFFDVRFNVMYDPGETCSGLTQGIFKANYVANYIKFGPNTTAKPIHIGKPSDITFYLADNVWEGHKEQTVDNSKFIDIWEDNGKKLCDTSQVPFPSPIVKSYTAKDAYAAAIAAVGACLPKRDAVDSRIVETVRQGTGALVNTPDSVGGWPDLKSLPAPVDSDHDGMPDGWEVTHGFNPNDAADGKADADKDGYTNLEEYLNGTDPRTFVDYRRPENNVDMLTAALIHVLK